MKAWTEVDNTRASATRIDRITRPAFSPFFSDIATSAVADGLVEGGINLIHEGEGQIAGSRVLQGQRRNGVQGHFQGALQQ